jgi:hypothetical protein
LIASRGATVNGAVAGSVLRVTVRSSRPFT